MTEEEERAAFIAAARVHLAAGTPYRHQGRSAFGLDCGGLLAVSLRAIGREPRDVVGYGRRPYRDSLRGVMLDNFGEPIPREKMRAGDVALMSFNGESCHVGIITDYPYGGFALLHAHISNRKVVEHRIDHVWANAIKEVFRP